MNALVERIKAAAKTLDERGIPKEDQNLILVTRHPSGLVDVYQGNADGTMELLEKAPC